MRPVFARRLIRVRKGKHAEEKLSTGVKQESEGIQSSAVPFEIRAHETHLSQCKERVDASRQACC